MGLMMGSISLNNKGRMSLSELAEKVTELVSSLGIPISDYHISAMAPGNSRIPLVELVTSIEGVNAIAGKFIPVDDEFRKKELHPTDYMATGRFTFDENDRYYFTSVIVDGSYQLMAFSHVGKVQE